MAGRKSTNLDNPLVDGVPAQTAHNCKCVLEYIAPAIHENSLSGDQKFGQYLILTAVASALESLEQSLSARPRALQEVVNG